MTARIGAPKTGGRRRGSLDKGERQLVTAEMASDLLTVYKKLGGVKWLLEFAKNNPSEFIRSGLSRLWPAPQKDDADFVQNNQFNIEANPLEAARRIAFVLALGAHSDNSLAPIDITPETVEPVTPRRPDAPPEAYPNQWTPPTDMPDLTYEAAMTPDLDRAKWAEGLSLTPDEKLVQNTKTETLSSYPGSLREQGGHAERSSPASTRKPTVAEIRRKQLL